ncbi:MAG: J domain-containing protein [Cyclobacteriaceae bacterium]|nr:J domain-containing protein [Cyclobacteriaceae bacterium]
MEDYYQILGISPQATQWEVRRSFRRLAVLYHPDKNNTKEGEERFKEINRAYEVLGHPEKRAQYDFALAHGQPPPVTTAPPHRDPAYRRKPRTAYTPREARQSVPELMAEFLPKFRWICYVGLVVTISVAIDYLLPFKNYQDGIQEINRIYMEGGGMIYDHDELVTRSGARIELQEGNVLHFKEASYVNIQQTILFGKMVTAAVPSGQYQVRVAAIYGNLSFIPLILFVSSLLGSIIRSNVEFPFNLSIVSFILLVIVTFLLIR